MKNRVIRAFSVICVFSLMCTVVQSQTKNDEVRTATAGIVSASTISIDEMSELTVSESNVVVTASADDTHYGYKNIGIACVEGNVNIREAASSEASLVGKMPENAGCEVLGVEGDWVHISSGEVEGYVSAEFLLTGEEAVKKADEVAAEIATVTSDTLRVRTAPSTDGDIIANIPQGEELEVVDKEGEWVKVKLYGEEGYVSSEFVSCEVKLPHALTLTEARFGAGVSNVRAELVNYALQFTGNPYVWGGTSLTNGADCSGFVLSVFANYGIGLPHSSRAQAGYGRQVSTSELQPGDLVFYGSGGISHVAIYIGGGQIVHASTERTGIIVSSAFHSTPRCCVSLLD